jgi:hypothetical protein
MPGFFTAWVVYGLTTYTKPPQFERVVQALIYSFLVNGVVAVTEPLLLLAGRYVRIGTWDKSSELIASWSWRAVAFKESVLGTSPQQAGLSQ